MYNLIVSSREEPWDGTPLDIDLSRCVSIFEYTEQAIADKFDVTAEASQLQLMRLPTVFAHETFRERSPHFGVIRDIAVRERRVHVDYEIQPLPKFLTWHDMVDKQFVLGLGDWEMNRTHWAVKDVNLPKELQLLGLTLPSWTNPVGSAVNINSHRFDVGLSFPADAASFVAKVAAQLEKHIGPHYYFYDYNYQGQLARPTADTLLQDIYQNRSKLIVMFVGSDHQSKKWCGMEWNTIRQITAQRQRDRVMYILLDHGDFEGVLGTDGYLDARDFSPGEIADAITERVQFL
ncbi:TIR domain-containing protein [Rhizobium sp. BR 362]|uniref:TIR domain-containing protein n=1 Tax=Rhizobium sp. BR 362 TaxID=3040670 RepID=UPI002F3E9E92